MGTRRFTLDTALTLVAAYLGLFVGLIDAKVCREWVQPFPFRIHHAVNACSGSVWADVPNRDVRL